METSPLSCFDKEDYALFLKTVAELPYLKKNPPKPEVLQEWYTAIMSAGTDSCGAPRYAGGWKNAVKHMGLGGSNMGTVLAWYRGDYNFFQSGQELYQQLRFEILPISDMAGLRLGKATEELNKELFHEKYKAVSVDTILDAVRGAHFEHNEALRVTPDDIVVMPNGGLYIVDYKTVERGKPAKAISNSYKAQLVQGMTIAELLGHHISGGIISYLDIPNMEAVAISINREEMLSIRKEMDEAREVFWGHLVEAERPPYRTPFKIPSSVVVDDAVQKEIQNLDWELAYYKQGKKFFEEKIEDIQGKFEELCVDANAESIPKLNGVSIKNQLTPESLVKVTTLYPKDFEQCCSEKVSFVIDPEEFLKKYKDLIPQEEMKKVIQTDTVYDAEVAAKICQEKSIIAETFKTPSIRSKTTNEVKAVNKGLREHIENKLNSFDYGFLRENFEKELENKKNVKKSPKKS